MAQISIGQGQGITQAIASHLGMSKDDCKKVGLAQWQQVMTLVDQNNTQNKANNKESIFTGGNNVQNLGNKANWKTDFVVQQGTVEIQQSIWDKIVSILKPSAAPASEEIKPEEAPEPPKAGTSTEVTDTSKTDQTTELDAFKSMEAKAKEMTLEEALNDNTPENGVSLVDEEWREMANRGDAATGEKYQELVKKFGFNYTQQIDAKYGNGDGILTYEEFEKHQSEDIGPDADAEVKAAMKESTQNAFKRLDLNDDNKIDSKEITTLLAAMDYDKDSNVNGRITINDFFRTSIQLGEGDRQFLDDLLEYNYDSFFGKDEE